MWGGAPPPHAGLHLGKISGKKRLLPLIPVLPLLFWGLFSCSNAAVSEEPAGLGGISIRLPEVPGGAGPADRSAVNPVEAASLYYNFTFTGPDGQVQTKIVRPWEERSFTVTAAPGNWNIQVGAYTGEYTLRGLGADDVTVTAGNVAPAQIQMAPVTVVSDAPGLSAAINSSAAGEIIVVNADFDLNASLTISTKEITIAADGGNKRTMTNTATDDPEGWFILSGTGSLTLGTGNRFDKILAGTLSLSGKNVKRFVRINNGGKCTLRDGAELVNAYKSTSSTSGVSSYGGAVYVANGGNFRMEGGEISGNGFSVDATSGTVTMLGGGVYVTGADAVFTMTGGTITNNTVVASGTTGSGKMARGGGVYVDSGAIFTMSGGTISENTAKGDSSSYGGGVFISIGIFKMEGGTITGNQVTVGTRLGAGVYVSDNTNNRFWMKGDAQVDPGNPVYLAFTNPFIALNGDLTQNPAANITLPSYPVGTQILKYQSGMNGLFTSGDPPNYTRFLINGVADKIGPDGKIKS